MGRTQRKHIPPNSGGLKSRLDKAKKENSKLRVLANRQRRNIKDLTSIIVGARRAAENGDMVRCFALVSCNVKYPPSAAVDCNHEWVHKSIDVCKHCEEVWN